MIDVRDALLKIIYMIAQNQVAWDAKGKMGRVLDIQ